MNQPEEQFEDVQRLLKLKRYEMPPPGFFSSFSSSILAELEQERVETPTFWVWVKQTLNIKPVMACAYGFVVTGLLLTGARLSQLFETEVAEIPHPQTPGGWLAASGPSFKGSLSEGSGFPAARENISYTSTSPVLSAEPNPFHFGNRLRVQQASFSFSH